MNEYSDEFLAQVNLKELKRAEAALWRAFVWSGSPQGLKAWYTVVVALAQIRCAAEARQARQQEAK